MTTEKEAGIRVTIKTAGFLAGLRMMNKKVNTAGEKMGKSLSAPLSKGIAASKESLKGLFSDVGQHMKTAATLGGAFAMGQFITDAVHAQSTYRDMAYQLERITGESHDWRNIMEDLKGISSKTGQGIENIREAYKVLMSATGSYEYSQEQLKVIGDIATASGQDILLLASAAEKMSRKFGLSGAEASEAIALIATQADNGGPSLEQFGDNFDLMASDAANAGAKGRDGLGLIVGMMNTLNPLIGVDAPDALKEMFILFNKNSSMMQSLAQIKVGFKIDERQDFAARLKSVISDPKLFEAMEKSITGPAQRAFQGMTDPYKSAYNDAIAGGKTAKEATKIALEKYDEFIASLDKSGKTVKAFADDAALRMKEDPTIAFRAAMDKMAGAFSNDKMLGAISSLATILPEVADGFVNLLDFAVKHPALAAGGFIAAKVGMSFLSATFQKLAVGWATSAMAKLSPLLTSTSMMAGSKWALAAKASLVAAAAYIGYEIGKSIAEAFWNEKEAREKAGQSAEFRAFNARAAGSISEKESALYSLKGEIENIKSSQGGIGSAYEQTSATLAAVASLFGADVPEYTDSAADRIATMEAEARQLEESISKQRLANAGATKSTHKTAEAMSKAAEAASKFAKAAGRFGGSEGPPRPLHLGPGHAMPGQ